MGKLTKNEAKAIPILEVARSLGMDLKKSSPTEYYWTEHDSLKLNTKKNNWRRYSTGDGGDTIGLVEYVKGISYRQAMDFLETGDYETSYQPQEEVDGFTYFLEPYEKSFKEARDYLKMTRGLSDETIDYFYQKGLLAQATKRSKDGYREEVLVFKHFDKHKQLVGASLQGIVADKERYEGKGYLKQIMFASQGIAGLSVDIGNPKRLVFTEAPIDLMSYYEHHKDQLKDVRLVAMEGLKEGTVSRYSKELLQELGLIKQDNLDLSKLKNIQSTADFLGLVAEKTEFLTKDAPKDLITLAVDNDKAGRSFVDRFQTKNIPVQIDLPPLAEGGAKMDWNDLLQREKGEPMTENYRLNQARASLEREKQKLGQEIDRAFAHQRQTNGQPMNDKRGGASFMKQHQQIEANISTIQAKIKAKEERIERLEHQEHLKSLGLNKTGSGLEMSVRNIPRIREEIEKANRGESFYTATTIKRYRQEIERLEKMKDLSDSIMLTKGAESLIETGQLKQWQKQPTLYFIKGQKGLALELSERGVFTLPKTKYLPKNSEQQTLVKELLARQDKLNEVTESTEVTSEKNTLQSYLTIEEDKKAEPKAKEDSMEDISFEWVKNGKVLYTFGKNGKEYPKAETSAEDKKKSPEQDVSEQKKSQVISPEKITEGELINRNSSYLENSVSRSAPQPIVESPQSDFPTSNRLYFTTDTEEKSNSNMRKNMRRLNKFATNLQESARWYLSEVAGKKLHYFYMTPNNEMQLLRVTFEKRNWMHLTGITPVYSQWVKSLSEQFIDDIALGNGHFKDLKFTSGTLDKLKVLNILPEIVEADTFVFNDLSSIEKFNNLEMSKAITPEDTDLLLLFKGEEQNYVPASLMRIKGEMKESLRAVDKEAILGVYRERNGTIEQLSINQEFVKDSGAEMLSILENKQYEVVDDETKQIVDDITEEQFTSVLDAAYNVGVPKELSQVPDEFHSSWTLYKELASKYDNDWSLILTEAEEIGLLDKNSDFYKEWSQDNSYHNHYHVRINHIDSPNEEFVFPFKEGQLLDYATFVSGLYESNYDYFKQRQHSSDEYLPYAKVTFGLYAPEGVPLVEGIRYDVGDERIPISHIINLGEHNDMIVSIDEAHFRSPEEEEILVTNQKDTTNKVQDMTDVLDGVVNMGVDYFITERPHFEDGDLKNRLDKFFERYDLFEQDLTKTVDSFIKDGLVNLDSGFYEDWIMVQQEEQSPLLEAPKDETVITETGEIEEDISDYQEVERDLEVLKLLDKKDTDALSKHLKEGLKTFRHSDQYKQFLLTMSRFHNYSFRNVQLLMAQKPDVSLVASFNKWKKDFNRFVNKGEKSLKVWAPMQVVKRDKNGVPVLDERGEPKLVTLFKLVPVFDVSQTNGQELPKYINQLKGNPEGYDNLYRALRDTSKDKGVSLSFGEDIKKANGYYDPNENKIVIKKGMTKAQTLKTIIHEIAHSDLHNKQAMANNPVTRSEAELQAESVAFVVSAYYGFDTSSYSMPYLNSWLNDKVELSDLEKQLDTVQKEARDLINRVDKCLEKYQSKEVVAGLSQDKLAERIASLEREEVSESEAITEEKKYQASQTPSI